MDRLTSMAVFTKVVEANSFSAAARDLGISQATASKHVQLLESWLGARLLNRTTRRISTTEIGELFVAQCTRILRDIDDVRSASRSETGLRGLLRLAAPICFGSTRLGTILHGFMQAHPLLTVDVFLNNRAVDPLEEGFDLAIRIGSTEGDLVRRLAVLPVVLVAAPAYLDRRGTPSTPAMLAEHALLLDRTTFPGGWRFNSGGGLPGSRFTYSTTANNALVLRDAAIGGAGVLLAPKFVVESEIAGGRLRRLLPDWSAMPLELNAILPASRQLSGKANAFADYLGEQMARV